MARRRVSCREVASGDGVSRKDRPLSTRHLSRHHASPPRARPSSTPATRPPRTTRPRTRTPRRRRATTATTTPRRTRARAAAAAAEAAPPSTRSARARRAASTAAGARPRPRHGANVATIRRGGYVSRRPGGSAARPLFWRAAQSNERCCGFVSLKRAVLWFCVSQTSAYVLVLSNERFCVVVSRAARRRSGAR